MSKNRNNLLNRNNVIKGAALATVLGLASAAAALRRSELLDTVTDRAQDLNDLARKYGNLLLNRGRRLMGLPVEEEQNNFFWKAGITTGLLLGAGTALVLAPKTGKEIRSQSMRLY